MAVKITPALTALKKIPLFNIESLELIHGPPERILTYDDFEKYQVWMTRKAVEMPCVYLGAEMGLGKTAVCLKAAVEWIEDYGIKKILIIAPLNVANDTWPEEIAKWDFSRHLTYSVITGDPEQRERALARDADIHIINRENFVWLYERLPGREFDYDALIYDEASRLKEGSRRTKPGKRQDGTKGRKNMSAFGLLRRVRPKFKRLVELSGTPAPNGLIDLWGPIFIMDRGHRLGTSKSAFLNRWFNYDQWKRTHTPHAHSHQEIMSRIKDFFFSLRSEDYLTLPELIPVYHRVSIGAAAMEKYKRLEKDMLLEEYDIEAVNRGVLVNKLLQLANGSLYVEDGDHVKIHDAKIKQLESIVEESGGAPMMVAYEFKFDKEAILKKFPYARVYGDTPSDMRDWNEGKIQMLVVHPASAGHGLNFQYGSNIAVWYGLTWSLELYQQFIKRLHRRGQKKSRVFMHLILAKNTFDERMVAVLTFKGAVQDDITDEVRVMREDVK